MKSTADLRIALVKLGGSVVTDKTSLRSFSRTHTARLVSELRRFLEGDDRRRAVIVHGGGSFGHIVARRYRIAEGFRDQRQLRGFSVVRRDMRMLNAMIVETMMSGKLPAISMPPESIFRIDMGRIVHTDAEPLRYAVSAGLIPVSFGDAVMDAGRTFSILSGDTIMEFLSRELKPEVTVFCTDVDGVFTSNPKHGSNVELIDELSSSESVSTDNDSRFDVTGGMSRKLEALFVSSSFSGRTVVVNGLRPGRLRDALLGKKVICTRIV
ncbi:MAG: isopentenyl phosphate kinase family protein [Thermoplasmata archaeon YP2-bin.285]|uniref:Isopentenyl phosphate kinase n=1 Tax=Candidatus Sysuiplasma superficiale TaxID=2823368 RepID=A0A8J8CBH4_9ARCH|nr:isopentenyl phosphate kinase family protein [Candidatus Sysuiplasma superficiale]